MKWLGLMVVVVLVLGLSVQATAAEKAKTVSGKTSCGGCSGVTDKCCLLLTDKDGARWALTGDSDSLKAAFKARHDGKTVTATLAGKPVTKKGGDGKDYFEVKVSDVKVGS
jgi:hypothetical protein